jgi:hypothetical protein
VVIRWCDLKVTPGVADRSGVEARPREIVFLSAGGVREWLDQIEDVNAWLYDSVVNRETL